MRGEDRSRVVPISDLDDKVLSRDVRGRSRGGRRGLTDRVLP